MPSRKVCERENKEGTKESLGETMAFETPIFGNYENLLQELNREDVREYKKFICVSPELFMELLHHMGPSIEKKNTTWRPA